MNSAARSVALVNPNTDPAITSRMVAIARQAAGGRLTIDGLTAPFGARLIVNEEDLALAVKAVASLTSDLASRYSGVIVAAFGDPGVGILRAALAIPVVGIGEAALNEAVLGDRRFCVATTTPRLEASIDRQVEAMGLTRNYSGVALTDDDAVSTIEDPRLLEEELRATIERAIARFGVDAIVVGGGPLANAARALAATMKIAIVEPVPAAVRRLIYLIERGRRPSAE